MSLTEVSVVTVLYNSAEVIEACLDSVPAEAEMIVVDNASSDDGAVRARARRPEALIVRSEHNLGFGGGCNLGWREATRPYVAFVNPDVRLRPDTLELLVRRLLAAGPGTIVGPALLEETGVARACKRRTSVWRDIVGLLPTAERWAPAIVYGELPRTNPVHSRGGTVDVLEGACFVVRRSDLETIGGFDPDLFLYYEEESLALRLHSLGAPAVYEPAAVAEHIGGTSTEPVALFATRHMHRSRMIFLRKRDGEIRAWAAGIGLATAAAASLILAAGRRALGREPSAGVDHWQAVLRGLRDGLSARLGPPLTYRTSR